MTSTRFDPFRELSLLQNRISRAFGDPYVRDEDLGPAANWVPPVDIFETSTHDLVIKVELPDMAREDITVTVEHNTLTVKGTKKAPGDVQDEQFRRMERRYGTFARSFTLPNTVDPAKVTADYKNGVLTVTLPYKEEVKPRTISVEIAA
jgi:HSP20 family protein